MEDIRQIVKQGGLIRYIICSILSLFVIIGCSKKKEPSLEEAISDKYEIQCAQLHRIACDFDSYWNGLLQGKTQDISILKQPEILTVSIFRDELNGRNNYIISGYFDAEESKWIHNPLEPSVGIPSANVGHLTCHDDVKLKIVEYSVVVSDKSGNQLGYTITFDVSKMEQNFQKLVSDLERISD
jgi:hypothetical protein